MNKIVSKLTIPITTHSVTPKINGFVPTDLKTFRDRPEPIKNRVTVIPFFESMTMNEVIFSGKLKIVLETMAKIKKKINHGIFTLASFCLKKKVVAIDTGIIQSARVNFTIVATSRAFCP